MRPLFAARLFAALLLLLAGATAARAAAPLTLDEALAMAARRNADLAGARADLASARADAQSARAGLLPRLDLSGTAGHEYLGASGGESLSTVGGVSTPVGFTQPAFDSQIYSLDLQATQPLLDLGHLRTVEQAGHGLRASERQHDEAEILVAFQVTQRFYEVVKQERSLAVLRKTSDRSSELVSRADALFVAGRTPKSDTYSARVNLQTDRIAAEAQALRVAQARSALGQVLGLKDGEEILVAPPPELDLPVPVEPLPPLQDLLARARERRPSLGAGAARMEAARAGVGVARAGYYPTVSLQASYSRSTSRLFGRDGAIGDPARAYTALGQVVLSWNVFQGFGTDAEMRRAEAGLAHAMATAERDEEMVAQEVADARAAVVALALQERLSEENLQVARDGLRLATERFAAGLANQLEERDASLKLSQAELTLLETRIDHAVARADLARAVGGTP
jgi:outer membrane protein TolC